MAVLAGFATALGGGTAALAGANVDGAVAAAMNEAMNNSGEHPGQKGLVGNAVDAWNAFQNARSTIASLPGQFVDVVKANNGQTPPSDPNKQIADAGGGNNTPPTAGAVVTPLPCPAGPGACGMAVTPVVTPGAPILASGGGGEGAQSGSGSPNDADSSTSVWTKRPFDRGTDIEKQIGQNLPQNFPVIDRFENGVATSIKSLDVNASSYQSTATLTRTLNRYIDNVAAYNGTGPGGWAGANVDASQITARGLDLVIPNSGSIAQQQVIKQAVEYGLSKGVKVNVIIHP